MTTIVARARPSEGYSSVFKAGEGRSSETQKHLHRTGEIMKARSELILKFMLALAKNHDVLVVGAEENAKDIFETAEALTDKYLRSLCTCPRTCNKTETF